MGKGQRARENRALATSDNSQKKNTAKKQGGKKWVTPLVTALVVVFIVGIFLLTYLDNSGILLRSRTVLETENYKVNGSMMKFATMSTYNNMVSQWGEEIAQYLQFDDMKESAKLSVEQMLVYAEAAKEAGVTLDEDDKANIDESIASIAETAKSNGYTEKAYLAMAFGKGVNKNDIRDFYEITSLATKYQNQIYDETLEAVTDEEIDAYYKENLDTLSVADVIKYSETLTLDASLSDDEISAQKAEFLAKFDAMGAAASEEEFKSALLEYLTAKEEAEGGSNEAAQSPETQVEEAEYTLTASEVKLASAAEWLFETDDELNYLRQNGEVKVFTSDDVTESADEEEADATEDTEIEAEETVETEEAADTAVETEAEETETEMAVEADDKNSAENSVSAEDVVGEEAGSDSTSTASTEYTVEVYYIVKAPYADDSLAKSTGHILIAFDSYETKEEAKAKADEVYAEFLAGEQTKDRFEELAEEYTDDSGVFYEDIAVGEMVEEFEAWVYDEARQYGDTDIVETMYGYHIMYFTGEATWLAQSRTAVVGEKTGDIYDGFAEKFPVSVNESALKAVKQ